MSKTDGVLVIVHSLFIHFISGGLINSLSSYDETRKRAYSK